MIRRLIVLVGAALMLSSLVPATSGAQGTPETPPIPFELTGTGAWEVANQMNSWARSIFISKQGMNLAYLAKGSRGGRGAFARGEVDFAISGRPMNDEDLAALAARKAKVIDLPISVASMAMLMSAPYPGLETFTPDPIDPEEGPGVRAPYEDNLRFPMRTLAQIFLDNVFNNWLDPDFLNANAATVPPGSVFVSKGNLKYPEPVARSEGSAANFYLQQAVQKYAPKEFEAKVADAKLKNFKITESWPFLYTGARSGGANAGLVGSWLSSKGSDSVGGGVITPTSNSEAASQVEEHPGTQLFIPEIENAAGEYVAPSTVSISLAIDKGDGAPLAAMNAPIPGAYPLAWVNYLYAPSSGLGIDATNALITFVRYAVTVGQAESVELDEGLLSPKLVKEALTKADAIVAGNCQGTDRKIIAAPDGGPFWPTAVALPAGLTTPWPVCAAASNPAPAVTVSPTNSSAAAVASATSFNSVVPSVVSIPSAPSVPSVPSVLSSGVSAGSSSVLGESYAASSYAGTLDDLTDQGAAGPLTSADPARSTGAADASAPSASLVAASLPMGKPDDGRGSLDRLSTMLLGAAILVIGRSFFRRPKVAS